MQKKILKVMMCAITTMTLLAGCGNSNTESTIGSTGGTVADSTEDKAETANFTGTKLVIGVESGSPNIEFFKNNVSEFETATGITIEWVEIPHDNMHERFVQEAISQSGAIDIYDTDQPWISEFASKGYLEPLGDKLSEEDKSDFYEAALDASSYNENLSKKSIDGFIGATNASSGKNILASKSFYTSNICVLAPKSSNISTLKQIKDNSIAAPADTEEEVFAKYLANRYKGRAVPFLSVREALSDIEAGNTQILVADKEYYKQHKETFKSWKVLKTSHRFQNEHRLFMQKDGKLQEIYSKGIKALETNGSLEHFSNTL